MCASFQYFILQYACTLLSLFLRAVYTFQCTVHDVRIAPICFDVCLKEKKEHTKFDDSILHREQTRTYTRILHSLKQIIFTLYAQCYLKSDNKKKQTNKKATKINFPFPTICVIFLMCSFIHLKYIIY